MGPDALDSDKICSALPKISTKFFKRGQNVNFVNHKHLYSADSGGLHTDVHLVGCIGMYKFVRCARTHQANFCFSGKNICHQFSSTSALGVFNFFPPKFCQAVPNFKGAVVLPRGRTKFCQASKPSNFTICRC